MGVEIKLNWWQHVVFFCFIIVVVAVGWAKCGWQATCRTLGWDELR
jgi:hypothetical protein